MTDKLFDNFIREKIINHSSEPPADMWDRILSEKKDTKKGFFWWENLAALGVLIGMSLLVSALGTVENSNGVQNASLNKVEKISPLANGNAQAERQGSGSLLKESKPAANAARVESLLNDKQDKNPTKTAIILQTAKSKNLTGQNINTNDFVKNAGTGKNLNSTTSTKNISPAQALEPSLSSVAELPGSNTTLGSSINFRMADYHLLLAASQKAIWQSDAKNLQKSYFKSAAFSSVDCPSERRNGNRGFYVEFFGSPDMAFKKMSYKNVGGNNYASRKDSTETRQLSFTAGIRLSKEIGDNMVFKTGLQYSQINERFDYRNENERNTTTVITVRTINNSDGTSSTVRDTSVVEQVGYRVKTTYNHYRSFDIPVLLGYEYASDGWKASLNGGAVFNISSWQEGAFLDTNYAPVSFSKTKSPVFKSKTGISLFGSISLIKNISDRMDIFAEPYFRYSLKDRTTAASTFNERFHTAGMLLGVRLRLNVPRAAK